MKIKKTTVLIMIALLCGIFILCGCNRGKPGKKTPKPQKTQTGRLKKKYDALILKSKPSLDFFGWKGRQEFQGAADTLHRLGLKFAFIEEDQLKTGRLPCKILILPNTRCMSKEAIEGVKKYVNGGGKLFATYMSGYRDENNHKLTKGNNFALAGIYGADFYAWTRGEPNCEYLKTTRKDLPLIQLGRNQAMLIKPTSHVKVLAAWMKTGKKQDNPSRAAVVFYKKKGVIYCGEDLFAPENSSSAQVAAYIGRLLDKLSPGVVKNELTGKEGWLKPELKIPAPILKSVKPGGKRLAIGFVDPYDEIYLTCSSPAEFKSRGKFFAVTKSGGDTIQKEIPSMEAPAGSSYIIRGVAVVGRNPYIAIYSKDGAILARSRGSLRFVPDKSNHPVVIYKQKKNGTYNYQAYRGSFEFFPAKSGRLLVNNYLTMEEYLAGVVPSEMPATYPKEALKAMAVTARTFAHSLLEKRKHKGFDICNQIHCQVYRGVTKERLTTNRAVWSTRGRVMLYKGKYPDATFHASNGGYGAKASSVWSAGAPYLAGGFDGPGKYNKDLSNIKNLKSFIDNPPNCYDQKSGRFRWKKVYSKKDLERMLPQSLKVLTKADGPVNVGKLKSIIITSYSDDGRAREMKITGANGVWTVNKDKMRWIVTGGKISTGGIPSTLFYIVQDADTVAFVGGGWGHGVGLSQEGARGRANAGQKYDKILSHYYDGVEIKKAGGP